MAVVAVGRLSEILSVLQGIPRLQYQPTTPERRVSDHNETLPVLGSSVPQATEDSPIEQLVRVPEEFVEEDSTLAAAEEREGDEVDEELNGAASRVEMIQLFDQNASGADEGTGGFEVEGGATGGGDKAAAGTVLDKAEPSMVADQPPELERVDQAPIATVNDMAEVSVVAFPEQSIIGRIGFGHVLSWYR